MSLCCPDASVSAAFVALQSRGGAIANFGSLNILGGSLFLGNYADSSGDGGLGGGIYNGDDGSVT